ncbi:hypothetical protein [Nocardia sp. SC052]|uniref:hypothetical protein n=1 Tax=Nocardia sichangensis TaxID=3385975 RepID=UPI0039A1E486
MEGYITVAVAIENGKKPMRISLRSHDWSTGDNPRFIAQDVANAVETLSQRIQTHLAQEFGDIRQTQQGEM